MHGNSAHWTSQCPKFKALETNKKLEKLEEFGLCHKCCSKHANECKVKFVCAICQGAHLTILHGLYADAAVSAPPAPAPRGDPPTSTARATRVEADGGEDTFYFLKTQLVTVRHKSNPSVTTQCLALTDEQAKHTFCDEKLRKTLKVNAPVCEYNLETLAGLTMHVRGHEVSGLQVRGTDGRWYDLPNAYTGSHVPDTRAE